LSGTPTGRRTSPSCRSSSNLLAIAPSKRNSPACR
jgi:hypothetical protein